ncbi:MAG: glycosyltransferase family 4 protein [Balneolaceae bacterium]
MSARRFTGFPGADLSGSEIIKYDRMRKPAMRIGMIMDTSFPPDIRVENEAITLMDRGFEVFLYHIDYDTRPAREEYRGIRISRKRGGWLLYKLSALVYTVPFFRWTVGGSIRKFIRENRIDILHVHDMVIAGAAFRANRPFCLPVILDLHENRPEIMEMYKHVNSLPGRWLIRTDRWRRRQRELMKAADHVILVTEEARRVSEADGIPLSRTTAVPNVVRAGPDTPDTGCTPTDTAKDTFTLLYIGDTSLRRGTETALKAVDLLREKIPGIQLRLVGSSSQDDELYRIVRERRLEGRVHFEGWQKPELLPGFIEKSDVCLSPLLRNIHHDTTYANKLFQYMAAGKPVVASDCTAQAAVVKQEKCGLVHRAGDAGDLADAVLTLYRDRGSREEMGRNGLAAVKERWNWETAGSSLVAAYERCLS